ncbi:MAG: YcbK family protein [Nitrospirae bacterium]|nr:YcbK family protein [Nitrospirota bacterium]
MISRRTFIQGLAVAAVLLPYTKAFGSTPSERTLSLYNVHTDESLDVTYFSDGSYDYEALARINHLMRCHHADEVKPIDTGVLDLLCDIKDRLHKDRRIEIVSGYRSAEYNEYLRTRSRKVARDSYHMQGLAIDFTVSGMSKKTLSGIAKSFYAGGVGKYRQFVHIDVGPVRYW